MKSENALEYAHASKCRLAMSLGICARPLVLTAKNSNCSLISFLVVGTTACISQSSISARTTRHVLIHTILHGTMHRVLVVDSGGPVVRGFVFLGF